MESKAVGGAVFRAKIPLNTKVYHRLQPWDSRTPGMTVAIHIRDSGRGQYVEYSVVWGDDRKESCHSEAELTTEDDGE